MAKKPWSVKVVPLRDVPGALNEMGNHLEDALNAMEESGYDPAFEASDKGYVVIGRLIQREPEEGAPIPRGFGRGVAVTELSEEDYKALAFLEEMGHHVRGTDTNEGKAALHNAVRKRTQGIAHEVLVRWVEVISAHRHPSCPYEDVIDPIVDALNNHLKMSVQ